MVLNPLLRLYGREIKINKKIITTNNTLDKALLVKFTLNTDTLSDHPSQKNVGLHAQICTKYCSKAFGGGPLGVGELTTLPQSPSWIEGE